MARSGKPDFAFTDYIRSLDPTGEPDAAAFAAAWEKLRRILSSELRQRSLATAPPTFLGIYGYRSWYRPSPGAFEELVQDCFSWVFVDRLPYLVNSLEKLSHIEGVVAWLMRDFLYDRQKTNDPLGFRVFEVLRAAIRQMLQDNALHVLAGDPKIRNATILGFAPETDPEEAGNAPVADHVAAWSHDLLPELVTAPPRQRGPVLAALGDHIAALEEYVQAFRFGEVARCLKSAIRRHWSAFFQGDDGASLIGGDIREIIHRIRPEQGYEERRRFEDLVKCVEEALPGLARKPKTLEYLRRLWSFVRSQVAECGEDHLPSDRRLEEILGIPRKRIPGLLKRLRDLVEECLGND